MVTYEDDLLDTNYKRLKEVNKFFTATTKRVELD